ELLRCARGLAAEPEADRVLRHAETCPACQATLDTLLSETDSLLIGVRDEGAPGAGQPDVPALPGYEILGELGRGGMGVVYKARQIKLNRLVAVKMILAGEHAGPEPRARFQREVEAVARLHHPNVVQIHEVGEAGGRPFCVLEFVDGGSL